MLSKIHCCSLLDLYYQPYFLLDSLKHERLKKRKKHYKEILEKHFVDIDYCLRKKISPHLKFGKYIHTYVDPNGGAKVLHSYADELTHVKPECLEDFAKEFLTTVFEEKVEGQSQYCMGIVHNAALCLPELVNYFNENYPNLVVKVETLGKKSDVSTLKMSEYYETIESCYMNGTFRAGGMLNISMVGKVSEETGGYFPELLDRMERDPFLNLTLPWGEMSILDGFDRRKSNDGPILWIRPGEQMVPSVEMSKSPSGKRRK